MRFANDDPSLNGTDSSPSPQTASSSSGMTRFVQQTHVDRERMDPSMIGMASSAHFRLPEDPANVLTLSDEELLEAFYGSSSESSPMLMSSDEEHVSTSSKNTFNNSHFLLFSISALLILFYIQKPCSFLHQQNKSKFNFYTEL